MPQSRTPRRPSHAIVVAYLALFVALGGTAYALGTNSVRSKHIVNGAVRSPDIKQGAVRTSDVRDDELTGDDVDEATLSGVDATSLGGTGLDDILARGQAHGEAFADGMHYYAYGLETDLGGTFAREFGDDILVRTTGALGEFEVCRNPSSVVYPWVVYLNGARSAGMFPVSDVEECTGPFDAGVGGDFTISVRSTLIFGVHVGGASENYRLYGFNRF
jgi:hypothetical protein